MRLFVGLALPDDVAASLARIQTGLFGARWQAREQLHLTLRFIGEVDGRDARMIDDALAGIKAPGFSPQFHGVGAFGGKEHRPGKVRSGFPSGRATKKGPRALWTAPRPCGALDHLARKVDSALRRAGIAADSRKFTPHVTLARLKSELGAADWLMDHALYTSAEFQIDAFHLYSSLLTSDGSIYRIEQDYPLEVPDGQT